MKYKGIQRYRWSELSHHNLNKVCVLPEYARQFLFLWKVIIIYIYIYILNWKIHLRNYHPKVIIIYVTLVISSLFSKEIVYNDPLPFLHIVFRLKFELQDLRTRCSNKVITILFGKWLLHFFWTFIEVLDKRLLSFLLPISHYNIRIRIHILSLFDYKNLIELLINSG